MRRANRLRRATILSGLLALSIALLLVTLHLLDSRTVLKGAAPSRSDDAPTNTLPPATTENPTRSMESESETDQRIYIDWVRAVVQNLLQRDDGASVAVAGRLMFSNPQYFDRAKDPTAFRKRVIEIFDRAAEMSPAEPVIQRMALWACSEMFAIASTQEFDCDRAAYDEALRKTDSNNGTVWLRQLADAIKQNDKARQEQFLDAIAHANVFHDYGVEERALMKQTLESVRLPPPNLKAKQLSSINRLLLTWPHRPMQGVKPLVEACQTKEAATPLSRCHRITKLIREKGGVAYAAMALGIERGLAAPGSAQAEIETAQRRLSWQRQQVLKVPNVRGMAPRYMESTTTVEQLESLLKESGLALDPPNDWEQ